MSDLRIRGDASPSRNMRVLVQRFMQRLRQKVGIQNESVTLDLGDAVLTTVPLDAERPEDFYLESTRLWEVGFSLKPAAILEPAVWLENNVAHISVIEEITVVSTTGAAVGVYVTTANLINAETRTAGPLKWRDSRGTNLNGAGPTAAEINDAIRVQIQTRGGIITTTVEKSIVRFLAPGRNIINRVLTPGWGIVLLSTNGTEDLHVTVHGYERALSESEVNLQQKF